MPVAHWIQLLDTVSTEIEPEPPPSQAPPREEGAPLASGKGLARVNIDIAREVFIVGEPSRIYARITDINNEPFEPDVIRAGVYIGGDVSTFEGDEVVNEGDGVYAIELTFNIAGSMTARWHVDGTNVEQRGTVVWPTSLDRLRALLRR